VGYLGWGGYLSKYFNFSNPINFFLGLLEIISEISRVVSFSFRLFGNVFAGEVLLLVIAFLIPVFISFPFFMMEIFVGFVQALVFSMLTAVFLNMAVAKHH
jgi:F-type H+-transporting ATPase subunit a